MSAELAVDAMRLGWLTLSFMMLASRVAFQLAGPARMRSFLDGWQGGRVKRFWGAATLSYAVLLSVAGLPRLGELSTLDIVLLVALLLVLLVDGSLNVLPKGFETFKDRVQDAWVRRRRGTGKEDDRYLFGTVNAGLALAALATVALVIAYRPIGVGEVGLAAALALVLTAVLIVASTYESAGAR